MWKQILLVSSLIVAVSAEAAPTRGSYRGGVSTKKSSSGGQPKTRWTLVDFLAQKQSIKLMDLWLSMNRSGSLFEASVGGGPVGYRYRETGGGVTTANGNKTSQQYTLSMFVGFFGIEGEYEETNHDLKTYGGDVALRLLGDSQQGTHLTVKYGLQKREDSSNIPKEIWSNQFAQADLNLYIVSFFGIKGQYRHYLPDKSTQGTDLHGNRTTAGAFFDLGMLILYGDYFQEKLEYEKTTGITTKSREGFEYGAKFYF